MGNVDDSNAGGRAGEAETMELAPDTPDIRERVIWVINEFSGIWRKYPYLEKRTGIKARRWQNVCNRVQQPTVEMIAALGRDRPYFLAYMLLGHDTDCPQVDPRKAGWAQSLTKELFSGMLPEHSETDAPPEAAKAGRGSQDH
ncbi:hypothetical protein QZM46_23470 [Burkholderia vietnamiensis]|uniref:hypothetical protein n=1 Tax=Burkholderia vietnamiensis TaxID=60552 RepID=UPI0026560665|nr:hypothetical protein [Burkholderia vietnamiensis]MDN7554278.1 hypothetical protein [Burkholderia vietnamiensis]HDR9092006.1 hypothetical protein [Burkholderia vietnamiensis]